MRDVRGHLAAQCLRTIYLSAHLVVGKKDWGNMSGILNEVKKELDKKYQIRHTTLQVEPEDYEEIGEVHS